MSGLLEAAVRRREVEREELLRRPGDALAECPGGCGRKMRRVHDGGGALMCSGCTRKKERALAKKPKPPEEKELTQPQHEELMRRMRDVFAFANSLNVKMKVDLRFPPHAKRRRGMPADAIPARGELSG